MLSDIRSRVQNAYHTRRSQFDAMPVWVRRAFSILARLVGLAVLLWMAWSTYVQWPVLARALRFEPVYLALVVACYTVGFFLAVVSWRMLFAIFGARHGFLQDYSIYALMAAYRHLPVPYTQFASLMYYYKKTGVRYWTTGLSIVAQSVLHIVAGVIVAAAALCFDPALQQLIPLPAAAAVAALALVALHPAVFGLILRLRGAEDYEQASRIGWATMLYLAGINIVVLLLGGILLFACAKAVLDVPASLLPACVVVWALVVCVGNLLSWLPSDFGVSQILFLALLQGHLSVAFIAATLAVFRASGLVLDLVNAAIAVTIRLRQKEGTTE